MAARTETKPRRKSTRAGRRSTASRAQATDTSLRVDGYLLGDTYPSQFHHEFTPNWIDAILRHRGLAPPRKPGQPFALLDVGCGDGLGLVVMAAAHPEARFVGVDALADHVEVGAEAAATAGIANVAFRCARFAEVEDRAEPEFDYVTAQGVMSWVSPENRGHVRRIAASHLRPGGVACLGYNTMPGWTGALAFQQIARRLEKELKGGPAARFDAAVERIRAMRAAGAPALAGFLEWHDKQNKDLPAGYYPYEYFTDHWTPFWAADMIEAMEAAGFECAGTVSAQRLRPDFCLRAKQREILATIADPLTRATAEDIFLHTSFRADLYGKFVKRLARPAQARLDGWWASRTASAKAKLSCKTPAGTLGFDNQAARAILSVLDAGPAPLRAVHDGGEAGTIGDVLNAADALFTANLIVPAGPAAPSAVAAEAANRQVRLMVEEDKGLAALASRHGPMAVPLAMIRAAASTKTRGKPAMARKALRRLGID